MQPRPRRPKLRKPRRQQSTWRRRVQRPAPDGVTDDGRIRVPADLDAVTAVGEEDHSGVDPASIERIWHAARYWYRAGMHPAIQLCLRHNGKVVLNRAIGHGWGNGADRPAGRRKGPCHNGYAVLRVLRGQGDHDDRRAHAGRTRPVLTRRPRVRLPAGLHQPRQGPHHHPARDDPQRRHSDLHADHASTSNAWTTASTPGRSSVH